MFATPTSCRLRTSRTTDLSRALPDLGWSKLVTGPITVAEVPGDHLGLVRQPALDEVGAHISAALG